MSLPGPLTTLLIALPDAQVRQAILSDIQGDHWIQLILPGKPSSVRSSLGIPDNHLVVLVNGYDPLGWDGFHFALRGTLAQETQNADTAPLLYLRCETTAGTWKDFPLAAWERLVMSPGTDLYLQSRWHPSDRVRTVISDLETDPRKGSLDKAYKGLPLLRAIERRGGRPVGTGTFRDTAHFEDIVVGIMVTLIREGRQPTEETVVAYVGKHDDRQMRAWITQFNSDWNALRQRAYRMHHDGELSS